MNITSSWKKIVATTLTLFFVVGFSPGVALGYFVSTTTAEANTYSAGTLDFTTDTSTLSGTITSSSTAVVNFTTTDTGTIPPVYKLRTTPITCTNAFYYGLNVSLSVGTTTYDGALSALVATTTVTGAWQLEVSNNNVVALPGDTCTVTLHIEAYQSQFPVYNSGGFTAEEDITLTLTAGDYIGRTVVLNEVLPNPDPASAVTVEFIELFNTGTSSLDLTGWRISEETAGGNEVFHSIVSVGSAGADLVPYSGGSIIISANGWLALRFSGASSYLNNDTDTIRLYDASGTLRDSYTYTAATGGGVTPGAPNASSSNLSATLGKSDARIPDGVGAWVDPIPTPGYYNVPLQPTAVVIVGDDTAITSSTPGTTSTSTSTNITSNFIFASSSDGTTTIASSTSSTTRSITSSNIDNRGIDIMPTATNTTATNTLSVATTTLSSSIINPTISVATTTLPSPTNSSISSTTPINTPVATPYIPTQPLPNPHTSTTTADSNQADNNMPDPNPPSLAQSSAIMPPPDPVKGINDTTS
jgi:hypothetical protein